MTAARLWRTRLSVLSAAVLMLVVLSSGLLQTGSARVLSQVLDEKWRGAYDILVRPAGQNLAAAATSGFVEGNFVAVTGTGGISLNQLKAIRKIDGVAVAAPIGLVGQVGYSASSPIVDIPDRPLLRTSALPDHPALYEIGFTVSLTDAGGTRVVDQESIHAVLRRQTANITDNVMAADNSASAGWTPDDGITFAGPTLPAFSSSVIAVDPAAEMQLLGANGAFLKPLTTVPVKRSASDLTNGPWVKTIPSQFAVTTQLLQSTGTNTDGTESTEAIPLLVNNTPGASMSLQLTAAVSDKPVPAGIDTAHKVQKLDKGATYRSLGSSTKDLTSLLVPFETGNLNVPWPGTPGFAIDQYETGATPNVIPQLVGRPNYTTAAAPQGVSTPAFRVQPQGLVTIDGTSAVDKNTPGGVGAGVQAYRKFVASSASGLPPTATMNLPVGSFSLKNLNFGASGISYTRSEPTTRRRRRGWPARTGQRRTADRSWRIRPDWTSSPRRPERSPI